jgi:cytochrome c551/c552
VLFTALLAPAGFVGWAIGHYTKATKTVTRTVTVKHTGGGGGGGATTTHATTTAAAGGNAAAGKPVFASNGCGSCHTFKAGGATGTVGPDLDTKPAQDAQKAKQPLAAFLRESIVDPNAFVSAGYPKGVMPATFGSSLSKTQLDTLVAFLAAGQK